MGKEHMKITRKQLRRIIQEAQWGRFTGGAAPLDEPPMDSGPMTPEDQQRVFDMLVDSGSDPKELKATGDYPDVDSMSSEVARRYLKRKYDWLEDTPKEEIHPLDVNRDGKLTISEMKITRRQLRQIIQEELSLLESNSDSDRGEKLDPDLLKGAYVSSKEDREAMKGYIAKLKMKKKKIDTDGDGALDADELRDIADDLEGEGQTPPPSFRIPYRNYGYEGRRIISRDRAWLEFVPKGSGSQTRDDMFRAVTLLDSDDPEIGLAMATVHAPKSAGPLEQYDVYSVHATTTG